MLLLLSLRQPSAPHCFSTAVLRLLHLPDGDSKEKERALLKLILCNPPNLLRSDSLLTEEFSKVTEVRLSLVDGTGGIDYKRRVNESFDAREMEDGTYVRLNCQRWNLCASQLSGCSLNAEELAISKLGLPRPPRISEMSVEELDANEKQAFLNWRRMFVRLEENEKLVLTPFEKNLDIWRQLWQVLERSDLIFLVDDARGVLVHALQKRDIIARAKTVTGNTTLDVKAERTCRRCSHTSEIHAKAKKEMGAQDPNQTVGTTPSRVNDIDHVGSDSGTETLPTGPTRADGATGTTQTQQIPPIGTPSQDRFSPNERTSIPDRTSIPERAGARVWNRPGER
ncbi:hypothetical protein F2Q69_00024075 [Brassica cretica]|uniref:Uncharacterized protein n=1 Tax=Brassica cretica TaxID=69181 RepID=A0A8S9QCU9_BRACR|nr:hypothetical protein F2Q69_00024075 [Brassica cretica]